MVNPWNVLRSAGQAAAGMMLCYGGPAFKPLIPERCRSISLVVKHWNNTDPHNVRKDSLLSFLIIEYLSSHRVICSLVFVMYMQQCLFFFPSFLKGEFAYCVTTATSFTFLSCASRAYANR